MGVARQHAGITGQVENCQTVVFAAYVTARARTLFDFRSSSREVRVATDPRGSRPR